jgi:hypothetical protein
VWPSHPSLYFQGIDFLEPFIPIEITKYSEKEIQTVMDYFEDRRWIQQPEGTLLYITILSVIKESIERPRLLACTGTCTCRIILASTHTCNMKNREVTVSVSLSNMYERNEHHKLWCNTPYFKGITYYKYTYLYCTH